MAKSSQDQTAEITGQADRASDAELLRLTAALVAAYTSNNTLPVGELPVVIELVRNSLADLNSKAGREQNCSFHQWDRESTRNPASRQSFAPLPPVPR